ncbi:MAG: aminotransferase class IV, partial [Gammaproteobacteria bacterium]|nr:aminotransferase class IV [Gammaproteobacteria bacterium]
MTIVYLNGQFLPQEKATVSIMDRGFLFGDGVYEVIPVFEGKFFGFEKHIARLEKSLQAMKIKNPHIAEEWKSIFTTLLIQNEKTTGNCGVYCQITRGADTTRSHTFPDNLKPTVVAFITALKTTPLDQLEKGFSAITLDDTRRHDCYIKATNLLPNILYLQKAKSVGAIEAILIRNGEVLECTSSNVFIVKNEDEDFVWESGDYGIPKVYLNGTLLNDNDYYLNNIEGKLYLRNSIENGASLQVVLPLAPDVVLVMKSTSLIDDAT